GGPGSTEVKSVGTPDPHRVIMHDGRGHDFSLERDGFHFVRHDTKVVDFFNPDDVQRVYYPEMEALAKAESGASRVVVFDHTLRTADDAFREQHKIREVVQRVHNDYTEWSGPQRVKEILPDEADALLRRRFAIIQVWRPIRHPVETFPLAICDASSVSFDDFVISERRYPNRVGQTYSVKYSPKHMWYWFPRMRRDEALVFKVYDSLKDGRARWTAHTAFDDPTAPPNARPRESIEIRTLAFF
ncbi:MAG: CmcJ/NvfI family oxidoreductase, partial [Xanthobacteraceae bacterium]